MLAVTTLAPFGAAIGGVAIDTADAAQARAIAQQLARHRVIVLRDQPDDDAAFVRFLRLFGDLTFTAGETPVPGAPDLNIVSNVGRTTPPRSVFHTDTSYVARPPAITALRAVTVSPVGPATGGATLFSDQVRAAATLPPRCRAALAGRTLRHAASGLKGDAATQTLAADHPLLCRLAATGETALYLSTPERCSAISGLAPATSARLVAALYRHSTRTPRLYRHHWRAGDILLWDDRATMHRADHAGPVGTRILHRGLVLGDAPAAG